MDDHNLHNLTTILQKLQIRGEIEGEQTELVSRQVEVVIYTTRIEQGIVVPTIVTIVLPLGPQPSSQLPPILFIWSPLTASRLGTQRWGEPHTKVLGPPPIEYWRRGGGYNGVQVLKAQQQGYISPSASSRGFVGFEDFGVEEDIIVVKNQDTRSRAEWIWGLEVSKLILFSLAFTEY